MKLHTLVVVAAGTIFVLAAIRMQKTPDLKHADATAHFNAATKQSSVDWAPESPIAGASLSTHKKPLDGVSTFTQLKNSLESSNFDKVQKLQFLLTAGQLCSQLDYPRPAKVRSNPSSYNKNIQYLSFFCDMKNIDLDALELEILQEGETDITLAKALAATGEELSPEGWRLAEEISLKSRNPSAFMDAVSALNWDTSEQEWVLGSDLVTSPQERQHLRSARYLASRLVACDLSGGCEGDGIFGQMMCRAEGTCGQDLSVAETIKQKATPEEWIFIQKIYRAINARREAEG